MPDYYSGVGSRDTPEHILNINLGSATTAQELEALVLKVDELQAQLKSRRIIG